MRTLRHRPFLTRYQGGASNHVVQVHTGHIIQSGVSQSSWLRAGRCAPVRVPTTNRAHSLSAQATIADQQNINVQVAITYRIKDAEAATTYYDSEIYPREARADTQGLWQIDETVARIAFSTLASAVGEMTLTDIISGPLGKVGDMLVQVFRADDQLRVTGVTVVDTRLLSLRPDEGIESSLHVPLLEQLQAEADRTLYERQVLAAERESQISANEMQSKLDLARKRVGLVDQEGHNTRREAEGKAATDAIKVGVEVRRIAEKAKAYEADRNTAGRTRTANSAAYIQTLVQAGPEVAHTLVLKGMAKNMPSFRNIIITADVLGDPVTVFTGSTKAGQ